MAADCYICVVVQSTKSVNEISGSLNHPLGACMVCHVMACGHHGTRCQNPIRYECLLCIQSRIGNWGDDPSDPPTPVNPTDFVEQFLNAYPNMDKKLVGVIRKAVEEYEDFDQTTRKAAALAFATFAGIPEKFRMAQIARVPSEFA